MDNLENRVNITVPPEYNGQPITLIIRDGDAPKIKDPKNYSIAGVITSINEWVGKRSFNSDPTQNKEVVVFSLNPNNPHLSIESDPNHVDGTLIKVHSKLVENPEVSAFGINRDVYFTQKELKAMVRKYAHLFPDIAVAQSLIKSLDNFEAKFETYVKKEDDRKGNTEDLVKNAIKFTQGELPPTIQLVAPLYNSTEPVPLELEIEVEKRGNVAVFGFYCLGLEPLRRRVVEDTILNEVERLKDKFVCIEQF